MLFKNEARLYIIKICILCCRYYENVEETSRTADTQSEPGAANTDDYERSVTMYTDLVRYSKDDGRNYDIIQSNK
jgi:hypothetical protein